MASEDFSQYGLVGVPAVRGAWVPAIPRSSKKLEAAGQPSLFTPDRDPTIATGVEAEVVVLMDLLRKP